jgi:hypothetical protein
MFRRSSADCRAAAAARSERVAMACVALANILWLGIYPVYTCVWLRFDCV